MERTHTAKRVAPALVCAASMMLGLAALAPAVNADETQEPAQDSTVTLDSVATAGNGEGTINVDYGFEDAALSDVVFHLYDVAKWAKDGGYEPIGDFADAAKFPVDWDILNANQQTFRDLANTLAGYIEVNGTEASLNAKSDAEGKVQFGELADGLFLVTADRLDTETLQCTSSAMLVALPNIHVESGANQRIVNIEPKSDCVVPEVKTETLNVKKVWNDAGNTNRPKEITVALLKDGEVVESVKLNDSNSWKYSWTELESKYEWRVVEKDVPAGYTTISDYDSSAEDVANVTITNSKPAPPVVPPNPPAQTGADIAAIVAIAIAALGLGGALIVKVRRNRD